MHLSRIIGVLVGIVFFTASATPAADLPTPATAPSATPQVVKHNKKFAVIDHEGKFLTEYKFDDMGPFKEGLAAAMLGGQWGYMDVTGKMAIEPQYAAAHDFSEGVAAVSKDERNYGFIDKTNRMVIPASFQKPADFSEGRASFFSPDKGYGFIDRTGKVTCAPQFVLVYDYRNGMAAVNNGDLWGAFDLAGRLVVQPTWEKVPGFNPEGLGRITDEVTHRWIDKTGKVRPEFDGCEKFSEGLAVVKREGKQGYIDPAGKIVIQPIYEFAGLFHEGMADVRVGDRCGYIDKAGKLVIQLQFSFAEEFNEGLAVVKIKDSYAVIDKAGKMVIQPTKRRINNFSSGFASFTDESTQQMGMIDRQGHVVIGPRYKEIYLKQNGIFRAETSGGLEFINEKYRVIWKSE